MKNQINKEAYEIKNWIILVLGLIVMAFGVALSIRADLGTSPISSLPYVVSLFTPLTVGTATIAMHCVLVWWSKCSQKCFIKRKVDFSLNYCNNDR